MTYLTGEQAIAELERLEHGGADLLGIDGLLLHADGAIEGPIDLILDFTAGSKVPSSAVRFVEARQLIMANSAPNFRWEIVTA